MGIQMVDENEYLFKICFVCYPDELLTQPLCSYGEIGPSTREILGVNHLTKIISLDNDDIKLILADISTTTSFVPKCLHYFQGASAAIFAFSKNDHSFFRSAIALYHNPEIHKWLFNPALPVAFIGLRDDPEAVTTDEGQSLADDLGVDYYEMAVNDLQALDTVLKSLSQKVLVSQKLL